MYSKNNKREDELFRKYLETTFEPAQIWAKSEEGKRWIETHITSLDALRSRDKEVMSAVYAIYINGKCIYAGQSLRTVRRLYVHAYNLCCNCLTIFGMTEEEVKAAEIEFKIMTPPLLNECHRLAAEAAAIRVLKPVFQPYFNIDGMPADYCLPRAARRPAMIEAGVITGGDDNE